MTAPERIYAWVWELRPNRGQWISTNDPVQGAAEYTRSDTIDPLSDPRVKALVEALQSALFWMPDDKNRADWRRRARAALRAIEEGGG